MLFRGGHRLLFLWLVSLPLFLGACSSTRSIPPSRPFNFARDTFSFTNGLFFEYHRDEQGKWVAHRREPKPDYYQHCFVIARSSRQFFTSARFDPQLPKVDEETYRRLIRRVVKTNARRPVSEAEKIVIPGYADLREFSEDQAPLLQDACGGMWESYLQRGHWRMVFPFSRHHQEKMAGQLVRELKAKRAVVVHLVRFPHISINHAMLLFAAEEDADSIRFSAYDPNQPDSPAILTYDRDSRTFTLPTNYYFRGGRVDVYEIYHSWDY